MKKALKSVSLQFSENEKLKKAKSILDDVLKPMLAAENADEIDKFLTDELLDDVVDLFYDESLVKEQAESLSEAMVKKLEAQCAVLELENKALQAKIQKKEGKNPQRKKHKSHKKKKKARAAKTENNSEMEVDNNDTANGSSLKTEKKTEEVNDRSSSPTLDQFLSDSEMTVADSDKENDDDMPDLVPNSPEETKCESPTHDTTPHLIPNELPKDESSDSEEDIGYRRSIRKKRCSNCDYSTVSEANLINHQKLFHPKRVRRTRGSRK